MDSTVVNARFLKPLDERYLSTVREMFVVTLEDNVVCGGLGDAINRFYLNSGKTIKNFGIKDCFIPHGEANTLSEEYGLSAVALEAYIRKCYARG